MSEVTINSLCFDNVNFTWDNVTYVIHEVSMDLPMKKNVIVTGKGGSGKSVYLKILAGLLMPQKGHYLLNSMTVNEMSFEEFLPWRMKIGYSFEYGGLLSNRTLAENLMLPMTYHKIFDTDQAARRVERMLSLFQLERVQDRRPSEVSGGMRKSAVVARSLVLSPELLLLDEPSVGLSTEVVNAFKAEVRRQREEENLKHVFIATNHRGHYGDFADLEIEIQEKGYRYVELAKAG